jgi:hypothetical protein
MLQLKYGSRVLFAAAAVFALMNPMGARSENVGTSCEDCVTTSGAFSLTNETGSTVHYSVKWGSGSDWKKITLENGRVETHSHSLDGNGRAPTPYVQFDKVLNDGKVTDKEYKMEFAQISSGGFGPARPRPQPMRYKFVHKGDRILDIVRG